MPSTIHNLKPASRTGFSIIFVTLIAVFSAGCSYIQPYKAPMIQGNVMTIESVALLQEGLTKQQVTQLIGPPLGQHPFNPDHWEYVYYSANASEENQKMSRHLVLLFDEDQLLKSWQKVEPNVQLKKDDSWLGLGWI